MLRGRRWTQDLEHEVVGQKWLERYFDPVVTNPVLFHVDAKRYWTAVDQEYYDGLSISSKRSLVSPPARPPL